MEWNDSEYNVARVKKEPVIKTELSDSEETDNCCDSVVGSTGAMEQVSQSILMPLPSIVKLEIDVDREGVEERTNNLPIESSYVQKCSSNDNCLPGTNSLLIELKQNNVKKIITWKLSKEFDNYHDAHNYVQNESCWSFVRQCYLKGGLKNYYRCHSVDLELLCPVQFYFLFCEVTGRVLMFRTIDHHLHKPVTVSASNISDNVNNTLRDLCIQNINKQNEQSESCYEDTIPAPPIITVKKDPLELEEESSSGITIKQEVKEEPISSSEDENTASDDSKSENECSKESISYTEENAADCFRTDDSEDINDFSPTLKHNIQTWVTMKEFDSEEAAKDFIEKEKCWTFVRLTKGKTGVKKYYRCNQVKRRGPQCPARIYLYVHMDQWYIPSGKAVIYRTIAEHKHGSGYISTYGLSDRVKKEVEKLYKLKLKPQSILSNLAKIDDITLPKMSQLRYYLSNLRSPRHTSRSNSQSEDMQNREEHCSSKDVNKCSTVTVFSETPDHSIENIILQSDEENSHHEPVCNVGDIQSENNSTHKNIDQSNKGHNKTNANTTIWAFDRMFKNSLAADNYMTLKTMEWSFSKRQTTNKGIKTFYRCNQVPLVGPQCPAQLYLLYTKTSSLVYMYQTVCHHDHSSKHRSELELNDKVKEEINKLYKLRLNPEEIMSNLSQISCITVPTMAQITSYLDYLHSTEKNHVRQIKGHQVSVLSKDMQVNSGEGYTTSAVSMEVDSSELEEENLGVDIGERVTEKSNLTALDDSATTVNNIYSLHTTEVKKTWTKKKNKDWAFHYKFENAAAAYDYIKNKPWSFLRQHIGKEGVKRYYRCNQVKRKGRQCPAQLFFLLDSSSYAVLMYQTITDHDHDTNSISNYGITQRVKEEINKLCERGLKPRQIMRSLAEIDDITLPKMSQLTTYLHERKRACPKAVVSGSKNDENVHLEECVEQGKQHEDKRNSATLDAEKSVISSTSLITFEQKFQEELAEKHIDLKKILITSTNTNNKRLHSSEDEIPNSSKRVNQAQDEDFEDTIPMSTIKPKVKSSKKKQKFNQLYKKFESVNAAEEYIKIEKIWTVYHPEIENKKVYKYYRCNQTQQTGSSSYTQCPAKLYIQNIDDSYAIICFKNNHHNHKYCFIHEMSDRLKDIIKQLYNLNFNPKMMMNHIAKIKDIITMPKLIEVSIYVRGLRRAEKAEASNNLQPDNVGNIHDIYTKNKGSCLENKQTNLEKSESSQNNNVFILKERDVVQVTNEIDTINSWIFHKRFENINDADEYLNNNSWTFFTSQGGKKTYKKYYECNANPKGTACPARLYLLLNPKSSIVSLYSYSDHNHESNLFSMNGSSSVAGFFQDKSEQQNQPLLDTQNFKNVGSSQLESQSNSDWVFYKQCLNLGDAYDYLKNGSWSFVQENVDQDGIKRYYKCNHIKCRDLQYPAQIYLLLDPSTEAVSIYRTLSDHGHDSVTPSTHWLNDKVTEEINKMRALRFQPKVMLPRIPDLVKYFHSQCKYQKPSTAGSERQVNLPIAKNNEQNELHSTGPILTNRPEEKRADFVIMLPVRDLPASQGSPTENISLDDSSALVSEEWSDFWSSDEGSQIDRKQPRQKRKEVDWKLKKIFKNVKDAEEFIEKRGAWILYRTHIGKIGVKKQYYKCSFKRRRGFSCPAEIYMLVDPSVGTVGVYRTLSGHRHDRYTELPKSELKDSTSTKDIPQHSCETMLDIAINNDSIEKSYFTKEVNKESNSSIDTIRIGELKKWLSSHSSIPSNEQEVFVIGYRMPEKAYDLGDRLPNFTFVLSTQYLLKLASEAKVFHIDSRYKFSWQGFPVYVVGCSDKNQTFHPCALALASYEHEENFKTLFDTLKCAIKNLNSQDLQPEAIVFDGPENTFKDVFEDTVVRTCWGYASKNIKNNVIKHVNQRNQDELLGDIYYLQAATDEVTFDLASKAFLKKWEYEVAFINYFKKQWLTESRHWYLGAHFGSPDNNSVLETFVNRMQNKDIFCVDMLMSAFLKAAVDFVSDISSGPRVFATSRSITVKQWVEAYHWSLLVTPMTITSTSSTYMCAINDGAESFSANSDFDDYKKLFFSKWNVQITGNIASGRCSCVLFYKEYMCMHVLGCAIKHKMVTPPDKIMYRHLERGTIRDCLPTLPDKKLVKTIFAPITP